MTPTPTQKSQLGGDVGKEHFFACNTWRENSDNLTVITSFKDFLWLSPFAVLKGKLLAANQNSKGQLDKLRCILNFVYLFSVLHANYCMQYTYKIYLGS